MLASPAKFRIDMINETKDSKHLPVDLSKNSKKPILPDQSQFVTDLSRGMIFCRHCGARHPIGKDYDEARSIIAHFKEHHVCKTQ
jgi:hypothetical protein